jgi:uncharacterized membrane protein YjfL (UPF0719 family)
MWTDYLYFAVVGLVAALLLLIASQVLKGLFGPKITKKDTLPARLVEAGHLFAVFLIAASVVRHSVKGESPASDLMWIAVFGGISVFLLEIVSGLGIRLLLKHHLPEEIDKGNIAAGIAAGGQYAATGMLAASCIQGDSFFGLEISLLFFAVAQISLHLMGVLFRALTSYDDDTEILGQNIAAALSYVGVILALSILIGNAASGEFKDFTSSFVGYGLALLYGFLFYPVRQVLLQGLVLRSKIQLRGGVLDKAIVARDPGYAIIEVAAYIGTSLLIVALSA